MRPFKEFKGKGCSAAIVGAAGPAPEAAAEAHHNTSVRQGWGEAAAEAERLARADEAATMTRGARGGFVVSCFVFLGGCLVCPRVVFRFS